MPGTFHEYLQKLVLFWATSTLMTEASEKAQKRVPYVYYLIQFQKNSSKIKALINLSSEINAICLTYAKKLGLRI